MSATKKFDVVYAMPTKDPQKPRWINCGSILDTDKGFRLKLDTIPIGCSGWFALFDPKPREAAPPPPPPKPAVVDDSGFNDDIPF